MPASIAQDSMTLIAAIPGIDLDLATVQSNMIVFDISRLNITAEAFELELRKGALRAGCVRLPGFVW